MSADPKVPAEEIHRRRMDALNSCRERDRAKFDKERWEQLMQEVNEYSMLVMLFKLRLCELADERPKQ